MKARTGNRGLDRPASEKTKAASIGSDITVIERSPISTSTSIGICRDSFILRRI